MYVLTCVIYDYRLMFVGWRREIVFRGTVSEQSPKTPADTYYFPPVGNKLVSLHNVVCALLRNACSTIRLLLVFNHILTLFRVKNIKKQIEGLVQNYCDYLILYKKLQ